VFGLAVVKTTTKGKEGERQREGREEATKVVNNRLPHTHTITPVNHNKILSFVR